jgi:hypothetical protein
MFQKERNGEEMSEDPATQLSGDLTGHFGII